MAGPAVPRAFRLVLRRRPFRFSRRRAPASPAGLHPTTGKALAVAGRLAAMLKERGMERHVSALRRAGARLELNEADGIYAMHEVLRHLRAVRLGDSDDQEIFEGLIGQLRKTLND